MPGSRARAAARSRRFSLASRLFKVGFVLLELALVAGSYVLAFLLLFGRDFPDLPMNNFAAFVESLPLTLLAALVFLDLFGMNHFFRKTGLDVASASLRFSALVGIAAMASAFFVRGFSVPRTVIFLGTVILFVAISALGGLGLAVSRWVYTKGRLAVVGSSPQEIEKVVAKVSGNLKALHVRLAGTCLCDDADALDACLADASEVLIGPEVPDDVKVRLLFDCTSRSMPVYIVPQLVEVAFLNNRMIQFSDMPAIMIDRLGLTSEQQAIKRIFDLVLSTAILVLVSPVMLATALAVRLTSKGPALYSQERVTRDGKVFRIHKFRSMHVDAEARTGPVISGKADPRVTPVGRLIRRLKIDELPQFLNVLAGDMSIVGPRSERPFFVDRFTKDIPGYSQRFRVKAGITGFAQVAGSYDTLPEDKLRYDLIYIKSYSILLDLRLILQTVRVVFSTSLYHRTFEANRTAFSTEARKKDDREASAT